jgi:hypothetical protein
MTGKEARFASNVLDKFEWNVSLIIAVLQLSLYGRSGQLVLVVDSTVIFGSVSPKD